MKATPSRRWASTAVSLLGVALLAAPAGASAPVQQPFQIAVDGTASVDPQNPFAIHLTGSGETALLGQFRFSGTVDANQAGVTGAAELAAGNGAKIQLRFHDQPQQAPPPGPNGLEIGGRFELHGDGKFARSTGGGTLSITVGAVPGPFHAVFDGLLLRKAVKSRPLYSILIVDSRAGRANGINFRHQVVGGLTMFNGDFHAYLWAPHDPLQDLGSFGADSEAYGVNASGDVVGRARVAGIPHAFFEGSGGSMQDIDPAGSAGSAAYGVNFLAQAVGDFLVSGTPAFHAFQWSPSAGSNAFAVACSWCCAHAYAISAAGESVGTNDISGCGSPESFLWGNPPSSSQFLYHGKYDVQFGRAYAINDKRQVVGAGPTVPIISSDGFSKAFLWYAEKTRSLGTLGGNSSYATGINWWGEAVGYSETVGGAEHAFLWRKSKLYDLNTLIPPGTEWAVLVRANAINDFGSIVGNGRFATDSDPLVTHPFLAVRTVLDTFTLDPPHVTGGGTVMAEIAMTAAAPFDLDVGLAASGLPGAVSLPGALSADGPGVTTIARGVAIVTFPITTKPVATPEAGKITASFGGWSLEAPLTVEP